MEIFLLSALAVGIVLYVVIAGKSRPQRAGKRVSLDLDMVATRWQAIEAQTQASGGGKAAILEADKLFDYVLKGKGFPGQTMAERLKRAEARLSDRNAVWRAHKLRNTITHELGFEIAPGQAREAVAAFAKGLRDLGALR